MRKRTRVQRLYVDSDLSTGKHLPTNRDQTNHLRSVLRMRRDDDLLVFNGRDGEWLARIANDDKRSFQLEVLSQEREQPVSGDLHYLFAPLKQARQDYMIQKAVEMGVTSLRPVITQHGQVSRLNPDRTRANMIEAAQQCGILTIPTLADIESLLTSLADWPEDRHLIFCDEGAQSASPLETLSRLSPGPLAVLVGPEGGFSNEERQFVSSQPFVTTLSLGPRILRADTAAVAALACVQSVCGDWR